MHIHILIEFRIIDKRKRLINRDLNGVLNMETSSPTYAELARAKAQEGVCAILRAGTLLMSSGAEVYRVEETMTRLGNAICGVDSCIAYVTVTGIICSIEYQGQTVTRIARMKDSKRNLAIVNAINDLSRKAEIHHYSATEINEHLNQIDHLPNYSDFTTALWGAIGAAGFVIFFGGTLVEMAFVFVIGLITRYLSVLLDRLAINPFIVNAFLSLIIAILSVIAHRIYTPCDVNTMIISSIMLLVPGLMITNALRDSVMGEPLSALVLLTESVLVACAIALGAIAGLFIMGY